MRLHHSIRRPSRNVMLLFLAVLASLIGGSIPVARAASGSVILEISQAQAIEHGSDYGGIFPWAAQQDFYPKLGLSDFVTAPVLSTGPQIDQRDHTMWDPAYSVTRTWADVRDLAGGDVQGVVELWDKDDIGSDDQFDINAAAANRVLRLRFDVCSLRFRRADDPAARTFTGSSWMDQGSESDPGRVQVRVRTADGRSFLPKNVAIADASPVQAVFHPSAIVDGKATAFMVELSSSHPSSVGANVTVTLNDGMSAATDSKSVTVPPEGLRLFLFDGTGTAAPFIPHKQPNLRRLNYTVSIDVPADSQFPDPSGPFPNCVAASDNVLNGSLPVVITDSPTTLYLPWDWRGIGESTPARPPTLADANATFVANEQFRRATFPIADVRSALVPGFAVSPRTTLEPAMSIVGWSVAAHIAGLDRLVLMPRNGWFAENDAALTFGHGAIGMSLGEFAPHAVISEQGFSEAVVHEQGHTFQLSRRPCSTGGVAELLFGLGCRDEYTHAASDGRPYKASGYDVLGVVYPTGAGGVPGSREVRDSTNFMDTTGARDGNPYDRWIDNLSYDWLIGQLRNPQDPELISLSGYIQVPGGLDKPTGSTVNGTLLPSFRYMGLPDRPEATLNDPVGSGEGRFALRIITPSGFRLYNFTPAFDSDGNDAGEHGFFSFAIPWDAATTRIELIGPGKTADIGQPQGSIVVLASRNVSPKSPGIANLRASVTKAPAGNLPSAAIPSAGSLNGILIGWDQGDSDTPASDLSAMVFILPPRQLGTLGNSVQAIPLAINLKGGSFEISAAQLASLPGNYGVRIVVSDGVNTSTLEAANLFNIRSEVNLPFVTR